MPQVCFRSRGADVQWLVEIRRRGSSAQVRSRSVSPRSKRRRERPTEVGQSKRGTPAEAGTPNAAGATGREWLFIVTAATCLLCNLLLSIQGWNLPILDAHAFRQTQTALSSYWFVQEGFKLDYITPVLGPPWEIPLEFPLYQWIAAALHQLTGYGLDQCGRLVSLLFLYATLVPAFLLARFFWKDARAGWILVSLMLVNPIHVFWGRTFMIETTVLFFCTVFLWFFTKALYEGRWHNHVLAILCGCMAGLVKPTTYASFLIVAFVIYAHMAYAHRVGWTVRHWAGFFARGAALTLISIAATYLWTKHCDAIKALHPYQPLISSSDEQREWIYGSINQRLSWPLWQRWVIGYNGWVQAMMPTLSWVGVAAIVVAIVAALITSGRRAIIGLTVLAALLSGPLVFFNLYRHDYYQMAITIWACALVAFAFNEGIRRFWFLKFALPVFLMVVVIGYTQSGYMAQQERSPARYAEFMEVANYLKSGTEQDRDVLLVLGQDWTSEFAYYTGRKVRMQRLTDMESLTSQQFEEFRKAVVADGMRVGAIALSTPLPEQTVQHLLQVFVPVGAPAPTAATFPLSRDRLSAWPQDPRIPQWTSGVVYVIPPAPRT
jgi:hypothetical protein